jgi:predicted adenylyl cyclase CyaB
MARNIEIKVRVRSPQVLREKVAGLSDSPLEIIQQEDTFFRSSRGRLKLREMPSARAQLIYYERPDQRGPKLCNYKIFETGNPAGLKAILSSVLGIRGVIRKERLLYRIGQTRLHLDEVQRLGHFLELEVVLEPGQSDSEGERIARGLMAQLDVSSHDLIEGAYIDLLDSIGGNMPPVNS